MPMSLAMNAHLQTVLNKGDENENRKLGYPRKGYWARSI
jgi:hypothetical protein